MALHLDKNGKVQVVTPPKTLTVEEKARLDNAPLNTTLIKEASKIKFNVKNG
jgi:hypothetical protein